VVAKPLLGRGRLPQASANRRGCNCSTHCVCRRLRGRCPHSGVAHGPPSVWMSHRPRRHPHPPPSHCPGTVCIPPPSVSSSAGVASSSTSPIVRLAVPSVVSVVRVASSVSRRLWRVVCVASLVCLAVFHRHRVHRRIVHSWSKE
jgi:hypothetical protein